MGKAPAKIDQIHNKRLICRCSMAVQSITVPGRVSAYCDTFGRSGGVSVYGITMMLKSQSGRLRYEQEAGSGWGTKRHVRLHHANR